MPPHFEPKYYEMLGVIRANFERKAQHSMDYSLYIAFRDYLRRLGESLDGHRIDRGNAQNEIDELWKHLGDEDEISTT